MAIHDFIDLSVLMLLIVANGTPVLVARMLGTRLAAPIDGGHCLQDGRPLFGVHKTWRGFAAGVLATGLAGSALSSGFALGCAFGALALIGDLTSSFLKRRLALASGHPTLFLDQLPEALLPLLLLNPVLGLRLTEIVGTSLVFLLLDSITAPLREARARKDTLPLP